MSERTSKVKATKKEIKQITFAKEYYKLRSYYFTTIRGLSFAKKFKPGEDVEIIVKGNNSFKAKIIKIEFRKISDLELSFLKRDADAPGEEIQSRNDFLDTLNSFRKEFMPLADEQSEMAIFYLFRVHKFTLAFMQRRAQELQDLLQPYVEKIVIAGSIRRQKDSVKDVELVAIPKFQEKRKQIGLDAFLGISSVVSTVNCLLQYLEQLEQENELVIIKKGTKYIQFFFKQSFIVDLFLAEKDNFGLIFMIRTGSADYSHQFMIELNKLGQFKVQGGYLFNVQQDKMISIPDEQTLFRLVSFPYKGPHLRLKEVL